MRVFLDTNVLFSGLHSRRGKPSRILEAAHAGDLEAVVSMDVLLELVKNIRRKKPELVADVDRFLSGTPLEVLPDPAPEQTRPWHVAGFSTDAPVVAAAIAGEVDYFCTGDKRLRARARGGVIGGMRVVSPAELLRVLEDEGS